MERALELLVYATDEAAAKTLSRALEEHGFSVDWASTLAAACGLFLERGGHALLVIAPDVGPGRAREVIEGLRSVDDELAIVVFGKGPDGLSDLPVHRIRSFHPGSRAGIGAIQKVLCGLPG